MLHCCQLPAEGVSPSWTAVFRFLCQPLHRLLQQVCCTELAKKREMKLIHVMHHFWREILLFLFLLKYTWHNVFDSALFLRHAQNSKTDLLEYRCFIIYGISVNLMESWLYKSHSFCPPIHMERFTLHLKSDVAEHLNRALFIHGILLI